MVHSHDCVTRQRVAAQVHDGQGKPVKVPGINFAGSLRTVGAAPVACTVREVAGAQGLFWVEYVPEHAAPSSLSIQLLGGTRAIHMIVVDCPPNCVLTVTGAIGLTRS